MLENPVFDLKIKHFPAVHQPEFILLFEIMIALHTVCCFKPQIFNL